METVSLESRYARRLIAAVISATFILGAFTALLMTYNYDPHFVRDVPIYQYDFMPSEYDQLEGNFVA